MMAGEQLIACLNKREYRQQEAARTWVQLSEVRAPVQGSPRQTLPADNGGMLWAALSEIALKRPAVPASEIPPPVRRNHGLVAGAALRKVSLVRGGRGSIDGHIPFASQSHHSPNLLFFHSRHRVDAAARAMPRRKSPGARNKGTPRITR